MTLTPMGLLSPVGLLMRCLMRLWPFTSFSNERASGIGRMSSESCCGYA